MNTYVVIGNAIAFISAFIMMVSGLVKNKKKILYMQNIQMIVAAISNGFLGSIPGIINNMVGCVRNVLCYNDKLGKKEQIIIGVISATLMFFFNNLGVIGLLPLFCTIIYIVFINTKSIMKFKILNLATLILWIIHDLYIKSYVYVIFEVGAIFSNMISMVQIKKVLDKN